MDNDISKKYQSLAINLGQLLSVVKLYNPEHPTVKEKIKQVFEELSRLMLDKQSLILSELEGIFLINGEKIEIKNSLIGRFMESLHALQLGSLDLQPGLSAEELMLFINLLVQKEHLIGEAQIKEHLRQKGARHIVPRFATYKLVEEGQTIVKEGGMLSVTDIPTDVMNRFSKDLKNGEIGENLKKKEKDYLILAHDPQFLSTLADDLAKEINGAEEVEKIFWLIGDYLINEINTARQEDLNRKILDDLKKRLLNLWEGKPDKAHWKDEAEKTFAAINSALELKGLMLLYAKHKKGLELVVKKLINILGTLPPESQIYKKTKEDLKKVGPPALDLTIFSE